MSDARINVSLKESGKHDAAWITVTGVNPREVLQLVAEAAGIDEQDTLVQTVLNAQAEFQALGVARISLGARTIKSSAPKKVDDVHAGPAKAEPAKDDEPSLADLVGGCESVEALNALYDVNVALFKADRALTEAWVARGRALTGKA